MSTTYRYLGNNNKNEVHDLENQQTGCQIWKIKDDHKEYFTTLKAAKSAGYDPCAYCLEGSRR